MTQSSTYDTIIYIGLSSECNWGCEYCNAPFKYSSGDKSKALKISHLFRLRTIDYDHSRVKFIIFGGEPSIYGLEYNQSIINGVRKLHLTNHVPIEYSSNLSASVEFYNSLDVNSFLFSYHPSHISFDEFLTKFEQVKKYSLIRVANNNKDQFIQDLAYRNPDLIDRVVGYAIRDINAENLYDEYPADNIYNLTPEGTLWKS